MLNTKFLAFLFIGTIALTLAACGGGGGQEAVSRGDAAHGQELFAKTCVACHGPDEETRFKDDPTCPEQAMRSW